MPAGLPARARENGWIHTFLRTAAGAWRRLRDGFTARRLGAPGFRAGAAPKLMGLGHMRVGRDFKAGDGLWLEGVVEYAGQRFEPEMRIGDRVRLSDSVHIACLRRVQIGDGMLSGSHVLISDHTHGDYASERQSDPGTPPAERALYSAGEIVIGRNVWLGDHVAVLAGARIGDGAIIGAHSVVMGEIPERTIAVGAPARPVRRWDESRRQWLRLAETES